MSAPKIGYENNANEIHVHTQKAMLISPCKIMCSLNALDKGLQVHLRTSADAVATLHVRVPLGADE